MLEFVNLPKFICCMIYVAKGNGYGVEIQRFLNNDEARLLREGILSFISKEIKFQFWMEIG